VIGGYLWLKVGEIYYFISVNTVIKVRLANIRDLELTTIRKYPLLLMSRI